ncbi:MAG: cytochrome C [Gammaproteobacteria bacterium]|nr:cytochrome C [Gammaproteobacteria bacterium]
MVIIKKVSVLVILGCTTGLFGVAADDGSPEELRFEGYPDAPVFTIAASERKSRHRRCSRCHDKMDPNPTIRELEDAPHVDYSSHGKGHIWCLVCHDEQERESLRTLLGEKLEFTQAHIVCGSCHANREKDWYFGGHGKRLSNWQGERVIYTCTYCHDPHEPAIEPREPKPAPSIRAGLEKMNNDQHADEQESQQPVTESKQDDND